MINQDVILIDDDRLMHLSWKLYCKKHNIEFHSFRSVEEFIIVAPSFQPSVKIFIDSYLGEGKKGEVESEKIFKLGFLNLYLATGADEHTIQKPGWIIAIYSKSPENILAD